VLGELSACRPASCLQCTGSATACATSSSLLQFARMLKADYIRTQELCKNSASSSCTDYIRTHRAKDGPAGGVQCVAHRRVRRRLSPAVIMLAGGEGGMGRGWQRARAVSGWQLLVVRARDGRSRAGTVLWRCPLVLWRCPLCSGTARCALAPPTVHPAVLPPTLSRSMPQLANCAASCASTPREPSLTSGPYTREQHCCLPASEYSPYFNPMPCSWSPSHFMPCGYRVVLTVSEPSAPRKPVE
jgi:hypothetical protein